MRLCGAVNGIHGLYTNAKKVYAAKIRQLGLIIIKDIAQAKTVQELQKIKPQLDELSVYPDNIKYKEAKKDYAKQLKKLTGK